MLTWGLIILQYSIFSFICLNILPTFLSLAQFHARNVLMSRKVLIFSTRVYVMKIYDYNGKKNICGERIREARIKKKLSQADLAAKLQISGIIIERDSISRIEIGTRFVADYELMILSDILDVSVDWLLNRQQNS